MSAFVLVSKIKLQVTKTCFSIHTHTHTLYEESLQSGSVIMQQGAWLQLLLFTGHVMLFCGYAVIPSLNRSHNCRTEH